MKLISSYIPEKFVEQKERIGKTWRMLIAQGLQYETKLKELEIENEYYIKRCSELNKEMRNLNKKFEIQQHVHKTFIENNP